jgi:hypothetical protein
MAKTTPSRTSRNKKEQQSKVESPVVQTRKIQDLVRLLLFVRAGGRCEFDGCNKYLLEHPVTLTEGNFAQVAHVVAFRKNGPRGNEGNRPVDVNHVANLMLLCPQCHKLIDDRPHEYTRQTLEGYKQQHEERIHHVTGLGPEQKTAVVKVLTSIGNQTVGFPYDHVLEAITPRYPISRQGTQIDLTQLSGESPAFYEVARDTIERKIARIFEQGSEIEQAGHISLFALAPIPLLILLGKQLSNKVTCDLFQFHRDSQKWTWKKDGKPVRYQFREIQPQNGGNRVALMLSLSGSIPMAALPEIVRSSSAIYEITVEGMHPATTFLRLKQDLADFRLVYQEALGTIIKKHGLIEAIDLFPAIPAPIAVLCGRDLLPKVHPRLRVHDYNKSTGGFTFALEV